MAETQRALTPRQEERRKSIIDAASRILAEHGYDGLSMRGVAAEAGVSPSTLYEIYESKDSLILQSTRTRFEDMSEEELNIKPGLDRLLYRLKAIGSFFENQPLQGEGVSRLLFQSQGNDLATEVLLRNAFLARRSSLQEMIYEGQISKPKDIDLLARTLVSITWGTILFHQHGELGLNVAGELVRESISVLLPYATSPKIERLMTKHL